VIGRARSVDDEGEVAADRQRDIIRELAHPIDPDPQFQEILKQLMRATNRTVA
jgi:hypothetical protein